MTCPTRWGSPTEVGPGWSGLGSEAVAEGPGRGLEAVTGGGQSMTGRRQPVTRLGQARTGVRQSVTRLGQARTGVRQSVTRLGQAMTGGGRGGQAEAVPGP